MDFYLIYTWICKYFKLQSLKRQLKKQKSKEKAALSLFDHYIKSPEWESYVAVCSDIQNKIKSIEL